MANLLKSDLLRIVKDKLFVVLCIVCGVIGAASAFGTSGIYSLIFTRNDISAIQLSLSAFQPFSGFGIILAIFLMIIVGKDTQQGTIRNKIIMGKSRTEIFFSNLFTIAIFYCGCILSYAIVNLLVALMFFNFTADAKLVGEYVLCFGLQILGTLVLATAINFWSMVMKKSGGAVVLYLLFGIVLVSIIGTILPLAIMYIEMDNPNSALIPVLEFISNVNIPYAMSSTLTKTSILSSVDTLDVNFIVEYTSMCVAAMTFFILLGLKIFLKKDIK